MTPRLGLGAGAAMFLAALLVACGGGSSPALSPNGSPSPTPLRTGTPTPTAMPTTGTVPTAACKELAEALPGTYTTIGTFGNVSGGSYAQYPGAYSGTWAAAAYATPSPGPSLLPTASPTQAPTPSASPQTYVEYAGTFTLPGFQGSSANGPYSVKTTTGCFLLLATQDGAPVEPGQPFNSYALGFPGFSTHAVSAPVAGGNITRFTVSDLTPASGSGTFLLDNNASGTVTITGSSVVSFAHERRTRGDH